MARRRNVSTRSYLEGERSSIGDRYVDKACSALNTACSKEVTIFVPHLTADEVTPMILNDDKVARLKAVHGLLAIEDDDHVYPLNPWVNGILGIETHDRPSASTSCFEWHMDRAEPLRIAVQVANELHIKWGAVKHMLRWFNKNCTPGAIAAMWPAARALCPDSPSLLQIGEHAPVRYTTPTELSAMLPLIRATATTVAAMQMIPSDISPRIKDSLWLTLPARTVTYAGIEISLDHQSFFL